MLHRQLSLLAVMRVLAEQMVVLRGQMLALVGHMAAEAAQYYLVLEAPLVTALAAQSASSGPVPLDNFPQQTLAIFNQEQS